MEVSAVSSLVIWTAGIVATVLITKLLLALTRNTSFAKAVDAIPGPYAPPFVGNLFDFWVPKEDLFPKFVQMANKFSKESVTRYWLGPFEPRLMVHTATGAEAIMNNTRNITKADEYEFFHSWLGLGLLTSTGSKWLARRKILTPSFHFQILEDFINVFNEQSQILVGLLKQKEGKGTFNIFPYITHCTLDIISETAMGTHHDAQNNSDSDYVKAVYGIGSILLLRLVRPWLGNPLLFNLFPEKRKETQFIKVLHSHSRKVIKERRKLRENIENNVQSDREDIFGRKKRMAFLDTLLEAHSDGKKLSDEEIREEVDTFMFEGHDTTSAALSWSLFLLGHHPESQARLQKELDSILGDSNRPISAADLSKMKYLEAVIKEALRLYPSVPMYSRKLQENVTVDGHTIPAGCNVFIGAYFIHRNPDVFPDPEEFKPDRFLEQDVSRHPFAYIPFSAGPRNCIGQKFALMEEKVVLSHILHNFNVISHDNPVGLKVIVEPIIRPAFGLNMSLEKRTKIH